MAKPAAKQRQLNIRLSDRDRELLERAAELAGISMSALMLQACLPRAEQLLKEHTTLVVPSEVFDGLLAALDEPAHQLRAPLRDSLGRLSDVVESL